ncbi:MAG: SOS response-associated peptidase family protein [Opitutaceae bacterium]|nr:SOS response-associated peptidase family protein [Opitutaceae bacterium]
MCVAYTIEEGGSIARKAGALMAAGSDIAPITARWKIRPTEMVPVAYEKERCQLGPMRWGWRGSWGGSGRLSTVLTCARAETIHQKPAFREAARCRRGLMFATGFFELRDRRRPYFFYLQTREPFWMAALWEPAKGDSPPCCVLVTTRPNELVGPIHPRMPVLLDDAAAREWLGCRPLPADSLRELCKPFPAGGMAGHPVDPRLLTANFDGPACLAPWAPLAELF